MSGFVGPCYSNSMTENLGNPLFVTVVIRISNIEPWDRRQMGFRVEVLITERQFVELGGLLGSPYCWA